MQFRFQFSGVFIQQKELFYAFLMEVSLVILLKMLYT